MAKPAGRFESCCGGLCGAEAFESCCEAFEGFKACPKRATRQFRSPIETACGANREGCCGGLGGAGAVESCCEGLSVLRPAQNVPCGRMQRYHGKASTGPCRTPTVIPGAAPPRPRLGRGRRILHYIVQCNYIGLIQTYEFIYGASPAAGCAARAREHLSRARARCASKHRRGELICTRGKLM